MKLIIILLVGATVALSSCSSAYRTAQTPDDVYYSPGSGAGYAASNNKNNNSVDQSEYYNANANDQYLMMKVQDPSRWSTFDDYSYDGFSSPYSSFGFGGGFYSAFSPWASFGYWNPYYSYMNTYYMWNCFYNPYYYGYGYGVGGKYSAYNTYTGLHPFNVNTYRNTFINNTNSRSFSNGSRNGNSFYSSSVRRVYTNGGTNNYNNRNNFNNNNNNRSFSQPTRSYSPSSFGGGSSGGFRSSGGGFSRPGKG